MTDAEIAPLLLQFFEELDVLAQQFAFFEEAATIALTYFPDEASQQEEQSGAVRDDIE